MPETGCCGEGKFLVQRLNRASMEKQTLNGDDDDDIYIYIYIYIYMYNAVQSRLIYGAMAHNSTKCTVQIQRRHIDTSKLNFGFKVHFGVRRCYRDLEH